MKTKKRKTRVTPASLMREALADLATFDKTHEQAFLHRAVENTIRAVAMREGVE